MIGGVIMCMCTLLLGVYYDIAIIPVEKRRQSDIDIWWICFSFSSLSKYIVVGHIMCYCLYCFLFTWLGAITMVTDVRNISTQITWICKCYCNTGQLDFCVYSNKKLPSNDGCVLPAGNVLVLFQHSHCLALSLRYSLYQKNERKKHWKKIEQIFTH